MQRTSRGDAPITGDVDPRLVERLHVDLQRTASAVCPATR